MKLEVGQTVFFVSNNNSRYSRELTVSKVGRKYAHFDTSRSWRHFMDNLHNTVEDGDYIVGTFYNSEKEYVEKMELNEKWNEFKKVTRELYQMPKNMTAEKIDSIMKIIQS